MAYERNKTLDLLRGFAIIGMVFFSIIVRLADNLPDLLEHNVAGEVHTGDFVLSLFIFASGISTAYFINKRKDKKKSEFLLDIIERLGKLIGISILLSPFSSGAAFGMDEVMLIAIMFGFSIIFFPLANQYYVIVSILLLVFYSFLVSQFGFSIFDNAYLGGYKAAIFYLPIALGGLAIGKNGGIVKSVLFASAILFILSLFFFPIDKLRATPSFMFASVVIGTATYALLNSFNKKISLQSIEYLGQKSLRYWILMFVLFIIPFSYYSLATEVTITWTNAVIVSVTLLFVLFGVSKGIDNFIIFFLTKMMPNRKPKSV